MELVTLAHGSGGTESYKLIHDLFFSYFSNDILCRQNDASLVEPIDGKIAITTDSFVINPLFFPGGDIGKLAVCGTINDLSVSGARPLYITAGFIIEEGFNMCPLEKIVYSMAKAAKAAKVKIIAGDTKVVEKGKCDGIYINTTGVGVIDHYELRHELQVGDQIIVSGSLGDHGACIMSKREMLGFNSLLKSDCASLHEVTETILNVSPHVRIMRDPTRGGLATTLNELILNTTKSIMVYEKDLPIKEEVQNFCDLLGLDPLYVANEGKLICIVSKEDSYKVVNAMQNHSLSQDARIIGEVISDTSNKVYLKTFLGSTKLLPMSTGELLPRIC
ncbi:hydrogenase expression/formation protein HypE [Cellulosilyticum sp. I15G10I2]|uniref:hydrogenase expression/formation protein HypE n=1 Tax=Cellulosilyticum sp. I15G10I2 TaxID=1892843 RepID=UPI00085C6C2D|nr:hydrogenase expression/formation protein HypE [Cellulosilyticum sp. I15G10I2]